MAAYAALVSLMHIIDDLENHPRPPISLPKQQVDSLTSKVTFLEEFLEGYNPHLGYSTEADPLEIRIADAAYAAEDIIESHIVDEITNDGNKMSSDGVYHALEKVIEEMEVIKKEAMDIKQTTFGVNHQLHTKSTPPDSSKSSSSMAQLQQSRMVGADDLMLEMKDKLTSDRLALQIIPIVGMGGSGKTTLARNLYQDRLIKEHFDICAWTTISQEYSIREILVEVLKQLSAGGREDLSEGELGEMLHKHLYGRKYMIVLDDMWSIRAWDGVRMFLPNTTNGSRIVVTTRLSNLASNLPNSINSTLKMNLLDEADSWELLSKTVFGEKDCPPELEKIGKEIAKSCKGLGLSIVVVGGLLAKSTLTIEFWEHIKENLNSVVNLEDGECCLKILHMSYKQLPVHLKPCFLYMGVYPEDATILVSKLIQLWVAEGFLKPINRKSMEESARVYLNELTDRNLVLIDWTEVSGAIKQCKIHDLLRDLCLREAEKERFITIVASGPQRRIVNATQQRRIVVSSSTSEEEAINALSSMPLARSLRWYLPEYELPPLNLRLLRILELSSTSYDTRETCIESMHQLVNSRYINSRDFGCPPSIGRFWNLQTLCSRSRPTDFSWEMIQIRHIEYSWFTFLDNEQLQGDNNVLGNLQTLGEVVNFKCRKEIVKRIPNIKELKLVYKDGDDDDDDDDDRYCFKNIVCLDKLESLSCRFYKREHPPPSLINFPHSLKKLELWISKSECWNDVLDKIGALPLVQLLTLTFGRFKEGQWETSEGQFRSLKSLDLIECQGLQVWKTECSHFPCLEYLGLVGIQDLEEIPLDLAEISTLKGIELYYCRDSAVVSAKRIVEEQEESYGVEASLQVHVKFYGKNEALESLASANFHFN